jgi:hypothetical protein
MHTQAQPARANRGKLTKAVMKCELCSSGEREREHRLCLSCKEAMARLSQSVTSAPEPAVGELVKKQTAVGAKHAPIIAAIPNCGWL